MTTEARQMIAAQRAGYCLRAASMAAHGAHERFARLDLNRLDAADLHNELAFMAETMAGIALLLEDASDRALTGRFGE
jgi:hypothetical protein